MAPLMTYLIVNEAKFKKNICLGVTLPQEAHEDEEVKKILAVFTKESWIVCLAIVMLGVVFMFVGGISVMMTLWGIWIMICIVGPYVPYFRAHMRLKQIKQQRGWIKPKAAVSVDTSAISYRKWLSPWLFVPAVLLCLVPLLDKRDFWQLSLLYAVMCGMCWLGYRYLYRNKAEMVDADSELTKALTSVRRYNWGKVWLMTAYCMAGYCIAQYLGRKSMPLSIGLFMIVTLAVCVFALRIEMTTRRMQETLTKGSGGEWYVDDDEYWIGGIIYYNPNDTRFLINQRVGVNSSINLATVPGKIMGFFAVAVLAFLPFMGVWFDAMGNSTINVEIKEQTLIASNGMSSYKIDMEDIQEVILLDELPENLQREMGTGLPTLLKGKFSSSQYGAMTLVCDPTCPPYIVIKTTKKIYMIGTKDANQTERIYEELK